MGMSGRRQKQTERESIPCCIRSDGAAGTRMRAPSVGVGVEVGIAVGALADPEEGSR
jgi:hypothetical protein